MPSHYLVDWSLSCWSHYCQITPSDWARLSRNCSGFILSRFGRQLWGWSRNHPRGWVHRSRKLCPVLAASTCLKSRAGKRLLWASDTPSASCDTSEASLRSIYGIGLGKTFHRSWDRSRLCLLALGKLCPVSTDSWYVSTSRKAPPRFHWLRETFAWGESLSSWLGAHWLRPVTRSLVGHLLDCKRRFRCTRWLARWCLCSRSGQTRWIW